MFRSFKNIDSAFRYIRLFSYLLVLSCTMISAMVIMKSYRIVDVMQQRIYVLADGQALRATAADTRDNIPVEARDHVRTFHRLFFTLDPDDKMIQAGIAQALYLADGSAKRAYDDLRESGYYANVVAGNISQRIQVDSVKVNTNRYPYYFRCYATQQIIRPTTVVYRSLVTEGFLRKVSRSDNNPHGLLIERWMTIENRDLKMEARRGSSIVTNF